MLRPDLRKLVGEADTNALISGLSAGTNHLASLGPLLGLEQLARGGIDRATYTQQYGHVTTMTNVGWTPLFPRAAAIGTDVGAPLSHAAIVARELGIPAVVGCGNATMCLHTGDRVRVNGEQGAKESPI